MPTFNTEPADVVEGVTDGRGRLTLGTRYADQPVTVAVVDDDLGTAPTVVVDAETVATRSADGRGRVTISMERSNEHVTAAVLAVGEPS